MTFWLCRQRIHSRWSKQSSDNSGRPSSCTEWCQKPFPTLSSGDTDGSSHASACLYTGNDVCLQGQHWLVTSHLVLSPRKWWWARQMPSGDQLLHVKACYSSRPTALASAHTNIFISTQTYLYPYKQEATCLKWKTQPLFQTPKSF